MLKGTNLAQRNANHRRQMPSQGLAMISVLSLMKEYVCHIHEKQAVYVKS
jgi:hypothetical protein